MIEFQKHLEKYRRGGGDLKRVTLIQISQALMDRIAKDAVGKPLELPEPGSATVAGISVKVDPKLPDGTITIIEKMEEKPTSTFPWGSFVEFQANWEKEMQENIRRAMGL